MAIAVRHTSNRAIHPTVMLPSNVRPMQLSDLLSVPDFEEHARRCMPPMAYEFLTSGAADENTLRWNTESYDRIRLRPRVLHEVESIDTSVSLFGRVHGLPILLAPVAYHRALDAYGELATAQGAGAAGVTWVVSTATTTTLEDITRVATGPLWFQLYVQPDREVTRELVQRAEGVGCEALCLTVDTPVQGARDRQARARFALPAGVTTPYMTQLAKGRPLNDTRRGFVVTWKDVEWLRSITRVPVLLKGILTAEDAERAVAAGVDGIIVSNHGARNLDTLPATIDALPEVAERVGGRMPVLVDGGIRRGTDVVKAIALGANAVMIGRPYCYGLALGGAAGVERVVEILRTELELAMQLMGRGSLKEINRSALWLPQA